MEQHIYHLFSSNASSSSPSAMGNSDAEIIVLFNEQVNIMIEEIEA
jgi:hypothetical protein